MPAHLEDFAISNYRSCVRASLSPERNLSCLIGLNGSGKSSLLNALRLLKAISASAQRFRKPTDFASTARLKATFNVDGKRIHLKADIFYSQSDKGEDEVLDCNTMWNFSEVTKHDEWIGVPLYYWNRRRFMSRDSRSHQLNVSQSRWFYQDMGMFLSDKERLNHRTEKRLASTLNAISEFVDGISYYSASQFTDPSKCPASFELDDERVTRRPQKGGNHEKFMFDLYAAYKDKAKSNDWSEFLDIVGPDGLCLFDKLEFKEVKLPESRYQVGAGGKVTKQSVSRILVVPSVSIDGAKLSLGQLSEGTFKTLALLFYLVSDRSQLLLIEEPEVCVHHGLLTSIVELIKSYSSSKQVIFSTHSDFVLDRLMPENVFIVTRKPKLGTSVKPVPKALSKTNFVALKQYLEGVGNLGEYWRHGGFEDRR